MASACGPSKPGMLTSESTSRGAGPSSADSSEASLSTRTHSASMPAWRSSIIASSASSALSSTSTTRQRAAALPATGAASEILRRLVEHRPELAPRLHRLEELVHVHRLDHVRVHATVPAAAQVVLLARGRPNTPRTALVVVGLWKVGEPLP